MCRGLWFPFYNFSIDQIVKFSFFQERDEYTKKVLQERYPKDDTKTSLNADEMSEFYKEFLDRNWSSHIQYNLEWQKRNFTIIFLSILVGIQNIVKRK